MSGLEVAPVFSKSPINFEPHSIESMIAHCSVVRVSSCLLVWRSYFPLTPYCRAPTPNPLIRQELMVITSPRDVVYLGPVRTLADAVLK
jgi:hypothetical protein